MKKIKEIWNDLENDESVSQGILYKRFSKDILPDVFVAFQQPEGFIGIAAHIKDTVVDVRRYANLRDISVEEFIDNKLKGKKVYFFKLLNNQHRDIFSVLCEDLLSAISKLTDEKIVIRELFNRFEKWKSLFDKANLEGLSNEEQRGLYGELYFLRKFLSDADNITLKIKSWTGPSKEIKDFQFGSWGLEVKTTTGNNHQKIHISNERQLDTSNITNLYLNHLSLELREGAGETLPEIVDSIIEILKNDIPAFNQFKNLLFEAGYFEHHRELYLSKGYLIRNNTYYRVEGDFPRIEENNIPSGVGDVKYSIIVSGCSEYIVTENEVLQNLVFNE